MGRTADTYAETREFMYDNMIVRVHFPDITDDERARRMKKIHDSAARLLKSEIERKKNNEALH